MLSRLNRIASAAVNHSEVVAAFFVLAVVFMMVLPLPTWLVDGLIALNICIAILLVVFTMYLPGPLAFSTFPGVLLLTTLFRLALSITTTRLILLQADAGHIVQAFGNFVVGGDLVVGLVIFFILTIVQFLVITKGAERIAEVAARFSLDAMPGKQMSIDSDLRVGLIDAVEARRRRDALSRESQLFGAMDGAMKFVKGDAIAGLVIVAVNLLGGLAVGTLKHGMTVAEAVPLYSVLTIGDGLVAQIPALLIALTAGMIVTRVSSEAHRTDVNVGREIAEQILSQPRAWMIASAAMLCFALVPGMPTLAFVVLSAGTCGVGIVRYRAAVEQSKQVGQMETREDRLAEIYEGRQDVRRFDPIKPYLLKVSATFGSASAAEQLVRGTRRTRNIIVSRLGMTLPSLEVEEDPKLPANSFQFFINEIPKLQGHFFAGRIVAFAPQVALGDAVRRQEPHENEAVETALAEVTVDGDVCWAPESWRPALETAGIACEDGLMYICRKMEKVFLQTGTQFIGIQEAHALMSWLESEQSELAKELQRAVPMAKFAEVLQRLAAERVSLRGLRQIAEALIEWGQKERDPALLTEHVRAALRYQLCHEFSNQGHVLAVFIGGTLEQELRQALKGMQGGGYLALSPQTTHRLLTELTTVIARISAPAAETDEPDPAGAGSRGYRQAPPNTPPVLLVPGDIRRVVRKIVENDFFQLPVLSFSEVTSDLQIHTLGRIGERQEPEPVSAPAGAEQAGSRDDSSVDCPDAVPAN